MAEGDIIELGGGEGFENFRREKGSPKREAEPSIEPVKSKVAEILKDLRGRQSTDGSPPVTILDGINIFLADGEYRKAKDLQDSETEIAERLELNDISNTLEKILFAEPLTYAELSQAFNYFRTQRNEMDSMVINSFGKNEEAEQNSKIFKKILADINEAVPYTAESFLPEYPGYITTQPERFLDTLTGTEHIGLVEAKEFYGSIRQDVASASEQAKKDTHWGEQKEVMKEISAYLQEHRDTIDLTRPEPLLVTVTGDEMEIETYKPKNDSSLQEELPIDGEIRHFIFDPNPYGDDMKYMVDLFALDNWDSLSSEAVAGIEILLNGTDDEELKITTTQFDGISKLIKLFENGIQGDAIDKGKYGDAIHSLGSLLQEKVILAPNVTIVREQVQEKVIGNEVKPQRRFKRKGKKL